MLFSLVVAIMVILVTAFWAYQGLFSAFIMFLESVVACMIGFALHEQVHSLWAANLGPDIGLPLAFMLLFLGVLLGLKAATDKLVPGNVHFPLIVDRAGGGACGFFTGMILVGMALLAIQMLPLGTEVLGFERFTADDEGNTEEHGLGLFNPDRFTAALACTLSNDHFGGGNPLARARPDWVRSLYSGRAAPQSEARVYLPENALKVTNYWETDQIDSVSHKLDGDTLVREFETREPTDPSNKLIVCAVGINVTATKKNKPDIRFRLPQFRIIGPPPAGEKGIQQDPRVYLACGMTDLYTHRSLGPKEVTNAQRRRLVAFGPTTDFILGPGPTGRVEAKGQYKFDVAFEVPEDFEPWYVEFKRGARADLSGIKVDEEIPSWASRALGRGGPSGRTQRPRAKSPSAPKVGQAPGGRTHLADAIEERTDATALLPVALDRSVPVVARHARGNRLRGGDNCHFSVAIPETEATDANQVKELHVPAGKRMVQVGANVIQAQSVYGRALGFATRVTAQISIRDASGKTYYAIGQYAAAEIGDETTFEIQYDPNAPIPERCLKKPKKITRNILTGAGRRNTKFGYLFIVDPGVRIVSFHAGRGTSQTLNIQVSG